MRTICCKIFNPECKDLDECYAGIMLGCIAELLEFHRVPLIQIYVLDKCGPKDCHMQIGCTTV
jgi:hypothetical protein